ncbi:MAG: ASCH domain-containing protein [Halobacteriovoraceae bacterium]|jgi:hypothetical protein|nr:ASCH domain-containing protein [Halobacteriovoraceae bacterium]
MKKKNLKAHEKDVKTGRAISIKQPFVEEILLGKKKYEYRSRQTHIRGRVYLYASKGKVTDEARWKKVGLNPGDLPTGQIIGSVEIVDCKIFENLGCYGYKLKNPRRYKTPIAPKMKAQPCFFFPFGKRDD